MAYRKIVVAFCLLLCMSACRANEVQEFDAAQEASRKIGRGLNLGLVFERNFSKMSECMNKPVLTEDELDDIDCGKYYRVLTANGFMTSIKNAGFDSVRLPVKWVDDGTDEIFPGLIETVKSVVQSALNAGLVTILDAHYYKWRDSVSENEIIRFTGLWRDIADTFADTNTNLYFEILNEPSSENENLKVKLKDIYRRAVKAIRSSRENNKLRPIIIGAPSPDDYRWISILADSGELQIDKLDRQGPIIAAFHNYDPDDATHAIENCRQDNPAQFSAKKCDIKQLTRDERKCRKTGIYDKECWRINNRESYAEAAEEAAKLGLPITLGEFGYEDQTLSYFNDSQNDDQKAFLRAERIMWIRDVVALARIHEMSWTFWNAFGSFGFIPPDGNNWQGSEMHKALMSGD